MTPRRESNTEQNRELPSIVAQHLQEITASLPQIEHHWQNDAAKQQVARPILRVVQNGERVSAQQPSFDPALNSLDQQSILRAVNAAHAERPVGISFPAEFMNNGQDHEANSQDIAA